MNTHDTDSIARDFADGIEFNPVGDTCAAIALRVTGALGGGLALTALLATVLNHH